MNTFLFYVGSGKCPPGGGVNVTIKNWKLLRKKARSAPATVIKTRISRSSGCCPRIVPDSTRDFKNFMTLEQKNIMKFNEICLQISPVSFGEFF